MKENLATTVSITSTYAGEFAGKYIEAALLAGKTLGDNNITIKKNIKYKEVVKKLATASLIANATCDFTDTGTVTLTERIIEPKELQVNLELCKKDFHSDWEAISMGYSAFDVIPKNFSDFLIQQIGKSIGSSMETAIWQGVNAAGSINGFTTLFLDDLSIVTIDNTTITSSNVQAELAKVVAQAATIKYGLEKPIIYVTTGIIANYLISLGGFGASGLGANGYKNMGPTNTQTAPLFYAGLQIVEAPGLPTDYMVCAQKSNLWFGTGLMSNQNEVKVIEMKDGSQNVRYVMRFTGAVQYGIPEEIIFYRPYQYPTTTPSP